MGDFLAAILAYPTVLFTLLLGIVVVYWLFVIVGALSMDALDPGGHVDGALDGTAEGAAHAALEGADGSLDAAADGVADGVADGAADAALDGAAAHAHGADGLDAGDAGDVGDAGDGDAGDAHHGEGGFGGVLATLGLRGVPITIVFSILVFCSWLITLLVMRGIGGVPALGSWSAALGALVAGGAVGASVLLTNLAVRPLRRVFAPSDATSQAGLVGKECTIVTLRVDEGFGQAEIIDGGAAILAEVRCRAPNRLTKGARALVFDYDGKQGVFLVAPDPELPGAARRTLPEKTKE